MSSIALANEVATLTDMVAKLQSDAAILAYEVRQLSQALQDFSVRIEKLERKSK